MSLQLRSRFRITARVFPRLLHNFTMAGAWVSGLLVSLAIFAPLWLVVNRCLQKPTRTRSVIVFVLGDVGRSPRMMYHAESFANNGFETYIVGYRGMLCKASFRLPGLDKMSCRFKANTRSVVEPSRPVFLPPSTPSSPLPSTFCGRRPHKDNASSFSHPHHPPVQNSQRIRIYNCTG